MALVSAEIISARYDLKDPYGTQYSDDLLVDYYNRFIQALGSFLGSVDSDWVKDRTTDTLSSGDSILAVPAYFSTQRLLKIGDDIIVKRPLDYVEDCLYDSSMSAGQPNYFALKATNFIFDREADQDYTVDIRYNKKPATVTTSDSMPYNDEFNTVVKKGVVMAAKTRNQYDLVGDSALYNYFNSELTSKVVKRNFNVNRHKTDF